MKILVTGACGNIGKKLVPYLRKCGHEVTRLDISQEYAKDYIKHDIRDPIGAIGTFDFDVVYHLAGIVSRIVSEEARMLTVSTNIDGTYKVARFCQAIGAKMINFSTSEVYGNTDKIMKESEFCFPNNLYGLSKLIAEQLVEYEVKSGLDAVTVRPFMLYDEDETRGIHRSAMIRFAEAL